MSVFVLLQLGFPAVLTPGLRRLVMGLICSGRVGIAGVTLSTRHHILLVHCRFLSQGPRGLRRGSATARLLVLWVWNPLSAWMFVFSVVCCEVQDPALGWSLVQRSPTECGVSECDCEALIMRRPWPTGGPCASGLRSWWCVYTIL
jgi:hypothetical protein